MCLEDFNIIKVIGQGTFGKVFLVQLKSSKELFAMKCIRKEFIISTDQIEHTLTERTLLANLESPFVVYLEYAFQTEDKLYLVLEFV